MAWLRPALDFVGRIPAEGNRPTWCFSVGGVAPHGPLTRRLTSSETRRVERGFPGVPAPRAPLLRGRRRDEGPAPLGKAFWRLMGGRPGDHRDWPAIESWARQIATTQVARRGTAAGQ